MGIYCSSETDDSSHHVEQDARDLAHNPSKQSMEPSYRQLPVTMIDHHDNSHLMDGDQYNLVPALDHIAKARSRDHAQPLDTVLDTDKRSHAFHDADDYGRQREALVSRESVLAFDYICQAKASRLETHANRVLQAVRKRDKEDVFDKAPKRRGYGGQEHPRFVGDHFLYNADLIEQTKLYGITQKMPKGAHLHIHFNANLLPEVLVNIAKKMDRMFITSDIPLISVGGDEDPRGYYDGFDKCRIQFYTLGPEREKPANLFDPNYAHRGTMRFQDFLREFDGHYNKNTRKASVDEWLRSKLVFHEEEAHDWLQTPSGYVSTFQLKVLGATNTGGQRLGEIQCTYADDEGSF